MPAPTFAADIRFWSSIAAFEAHLAQHDPAICAWAEGIVYHMTAIPTLAQWRGEESMYGLARYYRDRAPWTDAKGRPRYGWSGWPHLFIAPEGLYQGNPLNLPGIHAIGANESRWGIEVVGDYARQRWPDAVAQFALGAGAALLSWRRLPASRTTVQGHRDYNKPTCPGHAINLEWVCREVAARMHPQEKTAPPPPANAPVTIHSPLLAVRQVSAGNLARAFLSRPHGDYSAEDVLTIIRRYCADAVAFGLDPLLVIAQLAHETSYLSSWWAQRPRRNPAGIGVTGEPGRGLTFTTWEAAIAAHLGRLLAYALPTGAGDTGQQYLITTALALRPLPPRYRGIAPTVRGLTGTWAADAVEPADPLTYADKLVRVANALQEAR